MVSNPVEAVQQAQARLDDLVEQRPDVRAARERAQAAQSALQLARAQQSNDITWGGTVDHYPTGTGAATRQMEVRLQMPLQWGYRFEGEIGRASAQQDQTQDLLERTRLGARAELQSLLQAWDAARDRLQTYERDILPRALAQAAVEGGGIPVFAVELGGHMVGRVLAGHEHQSAVGLLRVEQVAQQGGAAGGVDRDGALQHGQIAEVRPCAPGLDVKGQIGDQPVHRRVAAMGAQDVHNPAVHLCHLGAAALAPVLQ